VIVSTCNRVEVLACGASGDAVAAALPSFLAAEHGVAPDAIGDRLYTYRGPRGGAAPLPRRREPRLDGRRRAADPRAS
jgi:hypothetical protein